MTESIEARMDAVQSVHTTAFNIVASDVQTPATITFSMPSEDQSLDKGVPLAFRSLLLSLLYMQGRDRSRT